MSDITFKLGDELSFSVDAYSSGPRVAIRWRKDSGYELVDADDWKALASFIYAELQREARS